MRPSLSLALILPLLTVLPVPGQDLEPTLVRAASRIGDRLVEVLPDSAESVSALAVVSDGVSQREAEEAIVGALIDRGFKVVEAEAGHTGVGVLALRLTVVPGELHQRLVVETCEDQPQRFVCAFGDASWADEKTDGSLLIEGPLRDDPEEAVDAARALARRRFTSRAGVRSAEGHIDILRRVAHRTFVGSEQRETGRLHRAFVRLEADPQAIRRVQIAIDYEDRRQAVIPWARGGGVLALVLIFGLSYLSLDLRTKGYMTGRLRLLFGTLCVLGAGVCWSVPL
jgi:hypothetical protein